MHRESVEQSRGAMCRIASAIAFLFVVAGATAPDAMARGDRPNLVFILTDDHGIDAIEGADWPNDLDCHTPQLANLAANGRAIRFLRVNPLCSPTRASILTGRSCNQTGVYHIVQEFFPPAPRIRNSMQSHERTIAESLREAGYFTALIGKWHLGYDEAYGTTPERQGFDVYIPSSQFLPLDDPIEVGDELITTMVDLAIDAVNHRPDPTAPYALFFWSYDPHDREDSSGREPLHWWKVDESLLPSDEEYYHTDPRLDTDRDRYRAVVEALDTELGRLLRELSVIDEFGEYRNDSDTVVLVAGDNGTSPHATSGRGKGSLFEQGVRVPFLAFGERVPADGQALDLVMSGVDFYDTICDIASIQDGLRGEPPREGLSVARALGWDGPEPAREFSLSSRGRSSQSDLQWVALADTRFKLIAPAASSDLSPLNLDSFYDLSQDPEEQNDLVKSGMTAEQESAYFRMRDELVDHWCSAVAEPTPLQIDVPLMHAAAITSDNRWISSSALPVGYRPTTTGVPQQARILLRFDIDSIPDLLPPGRTIDDIAHAQIILSFNSDAPLDHERDIAPVHAAPITIDWWKSRPMWHELAGRTLRNELGQVDLAPHLIPGVGGSSTPFVPGTRVSMGRDPMLVLAVQAWSDQPNLNNGVILFADPLPAVQGDQYVTFYPEAILRITLNPEG